MGLAVGLDAGRTACSESIEAFVRAVDSPRARPGVLRTSSSRSQIEDESKGSLDLP
jgi:hypothetical protein